LAVVEPMTASARKPDFQLPPGPKFNLDKQAQKPANPSVPKQ
jgi:hypothetical protein